MINPNSKIFIAGHNGMVGSSIMSLLKKKSYKNLITIDKKKLNLLDQNKTFEFLKTKKPNAVILAAAKVGGIMANNTQKAEFIYNNLQIQNNIIHGSYLAGVKKLIFLGSSCIYPRDCPQPIKENYLLKSQLEKTNDAYAIAKIAGLKMCEFYNQQYNLNYITLMPCNLYGDKDNYDPINSHFLPALIYKIHKAKLESKNYIQIWGNGKAKRELMHVEDLSNAIFFFLRNKTKHTLINIGSNIELSILGYAKKIMKILNCNLEIKFDLRKPNGTPRKLLNSDIAKSYGWVPKISLDEGISKTYQDFLKLNLS